MMKDFGKVLMDEQQRRECNLEKINERLKHISEELKECEGEKNNIIYFETVIKMIE